MKKKNLQRLFALALAGVMVASTFTACGSKETAEEAPAAEEETKSEEEKPADQLQEVEEVEVEEGAGIESWEAFAENVELTIPVYDRGVEGVPAVSDNYWTKWIQENFGDKYNITVKFEPITRSDVLTDYAMLAAADDLPTILMEYDYPKQAQWADEGYLAEYDLEEFAKIAPTYYQRMVDLNQLQYTQLNGTTYFALAERPYFNTNYTWMTAYRADWLEQVGYDSYPTTWAEEKEMLQKIVDAGLSEHPLGGRMVQGAGVDQNYIYRTYPQDELTWATVGDYAIPALSSDAQKALLKRVNEQYNLGFIDPEYYVTDAETEKANFVSGKTLKYEGYAAADCDWIKAFYEQNPDGKLDLVISEELIEDTEGGTVNTFRPNNPFGMMVSFSSQATDDEIKAAMMYMEWMTQPENLFTMQWGIEGENFTYNEAGDPVTNGEYDGDKKQGFNNSKDYWCVTVEARSLGSIEKDIAAICPTVGVPEAEAANLQDKLIKNYYGQAAIYDMGIANSDCNFATTIEAVAEYQETLLGKYTEYRDALTMCKPEEFDAKYDELSQKYLDDGYQAVIDDRKEAYEAGLSTKLPQ